MSCEFQGKLNAYHDGELGAGESAGVEAHLLHCDDCARELAQLRKLSSLLAAVSEPAAPSGMLDRLHERAGAVRQGALVAFARNLSALAASIIIICSVVIISDSRGQQSAPVPAEWELAAAMPQSAGEDIDALAELIMRDLFRGEKP